MNTPTRAELVKQSARLIDAIAAQSTIMLETCDSHSTSYDEAERERSRLIAERRALLAVILSMPTE